MPLKILIVGAGVAGPALATLLQRSSSASASASASPSSPPSSSSSAPNNKPPTYQITIVERAPTLRRNGLQVDIRAQGITVARRLGLLDQIREFVVPESGIAFVDASGRRRGAFGKAEGAADKGSAQALTSEFEVMRGDLVDLLVRSSLEGSSSSSSSSSGAGAEGEGEGEGEEEEEEEKTTVSYEYNRTITTLTQDADGATVTFSDGATGRYDIVVGADGQGSRTRRLLLGEEAGRDAFKSLRLWVAYYTVPRAAHEDGWAKWFTSTGCRAISTRSASPSSSSSSAAADRTQVYLCTMAQPETMTAVCGGGGGGGKPMIEKQKQVFADLFRDAGWEAERLVGAGGLGASDDFYAQEVGQVKMPDRRVARGRVALLGDAGYCPSPISGLGTTASLVGAYVLAGEIARFASASSSSSGDGVVAGEERKSPTETVEDALKRYDEVMRPFVDKMQTLFPGAPGLVYPRYWWGVSLLNTLVSTVSTLRLDKLALMLAPEDKGGLALPEYPELHLQD
ncbi:monooxygenase [Xylariomycetidae sp. FL2044]|nr:monooxygenase [Xylariomycetidae sp. FL2044]